LPLAAIRTNREVAWHWARIVALGQDAHRAVVHRSAVRPDVVGVERVDERVGREVGRQSQPQQAAVPEVVDIGAKIREHGGRGVGQAVEDLDDAVLLGDEDLAGRR
jgi:hypothetical protein